MLAATFLASEHTAIADSFAEFVERELMPLARQTCGDLGDPVPAEVRAHVRRRSAALGFYAGDYPAEWGGQDMPLAAAVLLREAAQRSGCILAPYALASSDGPSPLLLAGTSEQKERYLRPLVNAEITRCLAVTEPDAGSDAFALRTTAVRDGDGWRIRGRKIFVSHADEADLILVLARMGEGNGDVSVFVVERGTPGLVIGQRFIGMSGEPLFELILDDAQVGPAGHLGATGRLAGILALSRGRLLVAAVCNGVAEYALRLALTHARQRRAFGQPIGAFQHVQEHLVASTVAIESAKLLCYAAATRVDVGVGTVEDAALAKLVATDTANAVVDRALQVFGAAGWVRGHPLEWLYRYVRAMSIVEGTSEIQKVIIARGLGLG
jgi:alkylation response protein AidB-like acyl-CoA dehydrogenase